MLMRVCLHSSHIDSSGFCHFYIWIPHRLSAAMAQIICACCTYYPHQNMHYAQLSVWNNHKSSQKKFKFLMLCTVYNISNLDTVKASESQTWFSSQKRAYNNRLAVVSQGYNQGHHCTLPMTLGQNIYCITQIHINHTFTSRNTAWPLSITLTLPDYLSIYTIPFVAGVCNVAANRCVKYSYSATGWVLRHSTKYFYNREKDSRNVTSSKRQYEIYLHAQSVTSTEKSY